MNKYIRFEEQPLLESGVFAREMVFNAISGYTFHAAEYRF